MKIWDKIKSLFNKNKTLPEGRGENIQNTQNIKPYILQREDGSTIEIKPCLDKLGNIAYQPIYNSRTGVEQLIPLYNIKCAELEQPINGKQRLDGRENIFMDINPNLLDNPYYSNYIANNILNSERISKIILNYQKYAGGIEMDSDGLITGKYVDQGIIDTLVSDKEEWLRRSDEETKREIYEKAANHEVNIKTSHAEDLSKYVEEESER